MATKHETTPEERTGTVPAGTGWQETIQWVLGIVGAVGAFMGAFIMFAGEDQSVGIGGSLSWRVGDLSDWWGYGLLIGGGLLLVIVLAWVMQRRNRRET